jgi:beta-glucanase (GH16 family)
MTCPRSPIAVVLLLVLISSTKVLAQTWGTPVWSDDFNGAAKSHVDPAKWTYDTGNLNVNHELEIYCSPSMTTRGCDPNNPNAFMDGAGHLIIQQRLNSSTWTSARLKTRGIKSFQYGRIEANLRIPSHPGLWPAFWMLGSNIDSVGWPACGEVDIMENWPGQGGNGGGLNHNATSMHGPGYSGANGLTHTMAFPAGQDVTGFHTYGIIWSKNLVQFYFDDPNNITFVRTVDDIPSGATWSFNQPFFLIANMAVGGDLGGTPDSGTASATPSMAVDYIRYYQAAAITGPVMSPANSISLAAGSSGSTTVNLNSPPGTGLVYLGCSGAPAKATCSINTGNNLNSHVVDFRNQGTAQITVSVTTTAHAAWSAGGSNGTPAGQYQLTITAITVSGDTSTANVSLNVK